MQCITDNLSDAEDGRFCPGRLDGVLNDFLSDEVRAAVVCVCGIGEGCEGRFQDGRRGRRGR